MDSVARGQLEESRSELTRLQTASSHLGGRCGFGIIVPPSGFDVPASVWDRVNGQIDDWSLGHGVPIEKRTVWLEPSPTAQQCLRWWGSERTVSAFCNWATTATFDSRLFEPFPTAGQGYQETLRVLWSVARRTADLSHLAEAITLPRKGDLEGFEYLDVVEDAVTFVLAVIDHFLSKRHHLVLDLSAQTAVLDGTKYPLSRNALLVLQVLLKHEGYYITEQEMKTACPELEGAKVTRVMHELPDQIGKLIQSARGRGQRVLLGDDPLTQSMS